MKTNLAPSSLTYADAFGISWSRGQFRVAPGSPLRPTSRSRAALLFCYGEALRLPPTPEEVETVLAELAVGVSPAHRAAFEVQGTILRAAAREYYAV